MATETARGTSSAKLVGQPQILLVTQQLLPVVWERAMLLLRQEKTFWEKYCSFEFAYHQIQDGVMQLWLANDKEDFHLACITEIRSYDKMASCVFVCMGGTGLIPALFLVENIENWARHQGASEMLVRGRREWKAALKKFGYVVESETLLKNISGVKEH